MLTNFSNQALELQRNLACMFTLFELKLRLVSILSLGAVHKRILERKKRPKTSKKAPEK